MSEKAINDGQWNPWRLLQDAEFIIRDLSPDHDFPGRIRTAREAHDKAIASGTDPETAAEERGRRRGLEERDELRDRMHQTIAFLLSCVASGEKLSDEEEAGIRAMLREGKR